jgi:hypothetical protein
LVGVVGGFVGLFFYMELLGYGVPILAAVHNWVGSTLFYSFHKFMGLPANKIVGNVTKGA